MTDFFLPGVEPDRAEARYAELAELADAPLVHPAERVRSVRFVQGAEEWTATVGERLSGQLAARTDRRSSARATRASRSAPARDVSDPATVHAVFDVGEAFVVVTDARPVGEVDDSTFDNPFSVPRYDVRRSGRFDG